MGHGQVSTETVTDLFVSGTFALTRATVKHTTPTQAISRIIAFNIEHYLVSKNCFLCLT